MSSLHPLIPLNRIPRHQKDLNELMEGGESCFDLLSVLAALLTKEEFDRDYRVQTARV